MEQKKSAAEVALPGVSPDSALELSELAANLQTMVEAEKVLLARQLHDELGGALVGAKMDLAWLRRRVGSTDPEIIARWERLERALETGIAFKRRVVEQLRPTLLDNLGFYAAARWLAEETCAAAGLRCELDLALPEPPLSKELGIALFRVLQESLRNVTRHAQAGAVVIRVLLDPARDRLRLIITDDGVGMSPERLRTLGSHGLGSMRHRMRALGGEFQIRPAGGGGTEVEVVAPLTENLRNEAHSPMSG
ncbi:MAG TPA: sensor histidine kinase [Steroidobacteraceae bacterium]|nr:sensor histidine kinase [Steroidobacteraceae bacterium]